MPNGDSLTLWFAIWKPALEISISTKELKLSQISNRYPLAFFNDKYAAVIEPKNKSIPVLLIDAKEKTSKLLADEAHAAKFSFDGKFIVTASLSGHGEIIRISDVGNLKRIYDLELHNFGTVLGLDIW